MKPRLVWFVLLSDVKWSVRQGEALGRPRSPQTGSTRLDDPLTQRLRAPRCLTVRIKLLGRPLVVKVQEGL